MKKRFSLIAFLWIVVLRTVLAGGGPSTYFNIYVPPNNDATKRHVALIVTAISDSTRFAITDDGMDGDTDDSVEGVLMAGQSYVLYIKDNGVNDDASWASGGTPSADGDYFIINSDKLVYASMSTDSDWQHDFVASVNKKSVGSKFIIYSPPTSFSPRDLNVFAYADDTRVTISKVSHSATIQTGYTDVDMDHSLIVAQRTLNIGQDIIHYFTEGRDIMDAGETFLIESNKPISVQYGALFNNARDGGGYVPGSNGSSSGELFYFAVPYQTDGEQEIRIVSWDDANAVTLDRYDNGSWRSLGEWELDQFEPADWVGRDHGATYATVFRVRCTGGKKVSVFETNWMETGSIGTSDMASMLSSADGTTSGREFLTYIAPPGHQHNSTDPFTGSKIPGSASHLYLFAGGAGATVTVRDAATDGGVYNKTFTIAADRYADAQISVAEWESIYNGTGSNSGPDRPYLFVSSDRNISVLNTNFNDNWMTYFGSSLPHGFALEATGGTTTAIPGDTLTYSSALVLEGDETLQQTEVTVAVGSGAIPLHSELNNGRDGSTIVGYIETDDNGSTITFENVPDIEPTDAYEVVTDIVLSTAYNNGDLIDDNTVIGLETIVSGDINGYRQESMVTQGIQNNSSNTSRLMLSDCSSSVLEQDLTDSWNAVWFDYNDDGWDDLLITDKDENNPNILYRNANGTLTKVTSGQPFLEERSRTVAAVAADVNNDGYTDLFVVNATQKRSELYLNEGGTFRKASDSGLPIHPEYFHGASFADFDNDGFLDLLITNFFITRFHRIYRNNGDATFSLQTDNPIAATSARATVPVLADYDDDGLIDVFIPNGDDQPNSLFRNLGNFQFTAVEAGRVTTDAKNSVSAAWGDYDNDGDVDLFVGNASGQTNNLYANDGNGSFTAIDSTPITALGGHSHGVKWIDLDNDTHPDLLVTNDQGRNYLYMSNGSGNFVARTEELISADFGNAYGVAWTDYDKDGDQDVLVATHGMEPNKLFCGSPTSNHWIGIRLGGTVSNRDAIGARVSLKAGGNWYHRAVLPVGGIGSQGSLIQYFGLGGNSSVDSVRVQWPSGIVQYVSSDITVDAVNHVEELPGTDITFDCFEDGNENGTRDASEIGIENVNLAVENLSQYLVSGEAGYLTVNLEDGEYTLDLRANDYWELSAPIRFSVASGAQLTVAVPLRAKQTNYDVSINVVQTPWRRGFANQSVVQLRNEGTRTAYPTRVSLVYPAGVVVADSDQPYTTNGNEYVWTVAPLAPGELRSFTVTDSLSLAINTGDVLPFEATVLLPEDDLDPANNTFSTEVEVVGALDPNDIRVSPRGDGQEGWVTADTWLTYTIRFQNVGTYYATNVFVTNALSPHLDAETLEIISTSHPGSVAIADQTLRVSFYNIILPDSTTHEEASHGYVQYRIKPKQTYAGGERITNQAAIVFDFEAPIITNRVLNTVKFAVGEGLENLAVFPNPAAGVCYISPNPHFIRYADGPLLTRYTVRNTLGAVVARGELDAVVQARLDLSHLPRGMAIIEAVDHRGNRYIGKVLLR